MRITQLLVLLASLLLAGCASPGGFVQVLPEYRKPTVSVYDFTKREDPRGAWLKIEISHDGTRPSRCSLVGLDFDRPQSNSEQAANRKRFTKYGEPERNPGFVFYGSRFYESDGLTILTPVPGTGIGQSGMVVFEIPDDGIILMHLDGHRLASLRRQDRQYSRSDPFVTFHFGERAMLSKYGKRLSLGSLLFYREQTIRRFTKGEGCTGVGTGITAQYG